jgi:hypothetical protein
MEKVAGASKAIEETTVFLSYFKDLPDPRQPGKVVYPLPEVLLLCLLAVLAGAESFVEIALFGKKKLPLLRRFRRFCDGTPSHDQLGDIFAVLDPEKFQHCFAAWVMALTGAPQGVIAIDGKTLRRSHNKKSGKAAIHMVSAFAAQQRLVLGQVKVATKSNEITAIPALLDLLVIEGAIVTIDAMGCQRAIATKIVDKKADYILALKSLPPRRRGGTRGRSTMMSQCSSTSRKPTILPIPRSPAIRPSMPTTAVSRPETTPSSMTWPGCRNGIIGRH